MTHTRIRVSNQVLENAALEVCERLDATPLGIGWSELSEASLWHELVACLLGSRVPFEHAQAAAEYLFRTGLLEVNRYYCSRYEYESRLEEALSRRIYPPLDNSGRLRKYAFSRLRASHIARTVESMYVPGLSIRSILQSSSCSYDARQKIMAATVGIGPKQASLFLRNVGYASDLAVLDGHVLSYMRLLDMLPSRVKEVSRLTVYRLVEDKLREYSLRLNKTLSNLDTAIWVVMRVYNKGFSR